ncbi:MAG TPA: hypothetical protein ENL35_11145 [Chloroflexi bacterium]|nr:hypothetical protein [Chloroflexota bacterium]
MSDSANTFNAHLLSILEIMAREGVKNAARGLSGMTGEQVAVEEPEAALVSFSELPNLVGGPEQEIVGIYLLIEGEMSGQIMLILPIDQALELTDLVLDRPIGTAKALSSMERSALAEVGNLTCSFFLNSISALTGLSARPSPPAVMIDMAGAILDIVVITAGGVGDHIIVLRASFTKGDREVQSQFWVIPESSVLTAIARRGWVSDGKAQ